MAVVINLGIPAVPVSQQVRHDLLTWIENSHYKCYELATSVGFALKLA